ncbi:MAG: lipoprotein-releasing ABC transporter permease subunit [Desulfobacteraceae bacterium]|nr:MAG: lipoprotein-releasing ABC transporter permease subunit [Desulfobacteraceae bacterium]
MTFEFFIAFRYLRAKRKEGFISLITFLSIFGVTLGVMALVIVIAVMSGAETDFRKRILGLEPHILIMNYSGKFEYDSGIIRSIDTVDGVSSSAPILYEQAMIRTASGFSGAMVRGIDPRMGSSLIKDFSADDLEEKLGKINPESSVHGIILGKDLARSIGAVIGEKIILVSPKGIVSPLGPLPSMKRFQVTGIFESGWYEYDSILAYVHLGDAQSVAKARNQVSAIGVWVEDVFDVKRVKTDILRHVDTSFYIRDWMDINQSLFSALKLEKTAMFIILTLIIFVAAFNIASTLIMMVMEKTKDIAVLKAMGATGSHIRKIFMIQGMFIGIIGTISGTVLGIISCILLKKYKFIELPEAYPFSTLPVQLEMFDVAIISISALLICFLSTLYPSYKASRMNTVEALRYG